MAHPTSESLDYNQNLTYCLFLFDFVVAINLLSNTSNTHGSKGISHGFQSNRGSHETIPTRNKKKKTAKNSTVLRSSRGERPGNQQKVGFQKPWLFAVLRGLYDPVICRDYFTNQY